MKNALYLWLLHNIIDPQEKRFECLEGEIPL